jgi:hypothetical protein
MGRARKCLKLATTLGALNPNHTQGTGESHDRDYWATADADGGCFNPIESYSGYSQFLQELGSAFRSVGLIFD